MLSVFGLFSSLLGDAQLDNRDELKRIVIDFLKNTDVYRNGAWNGSVEIRDIYNHKSGGKVLVAEFITISAGHPEFMCEAIEGHTAIITLNNEGQVVSAFCVHGSKLWDIINQKWVYVIKISEQQAIVIGKNFLNSIGCIVGPVLSANLEEKVPNFYWHDLAELGKPNITEPRLCWVIKFEQAYRPGHFFEVWLDAYTGEILGGQQCR
ncbi:MAG: hypothetical protein QXD34_01055 [Candidatus Bathyarchaeia archaeon]|nr:PepSY domain-containing protein [Candidatus Bathyarchaeota archaeon]